MIWLAKPITVGKTTIPAGTILNDKYQTGICYYKGTRVVFSEVPSDAIFVPGTPRDVMPELPQNDESNGTIKRIAVRSIMDSPSTYDKVYGNDTQVALTMPAYMLRPSIEAKHIGDIVDVIDYDYDAPGHQVVVKHGKLQALGTFAKLKEQIRKESQRAYDELEANCRTGHETVWKVDGAWFCHCNMKFGLEANAMKIVSSDTPNTDVIMLNDTPVATIISKELVKNSYPDTGYVNDEDHKISVLNNEGEPIELKCLDDDVVMEQTILDELAPIVSAVENTMYLQMMDDFKFASQAEKLQFAALVTELSQAFRNIDAHAADDNGYVGDGVGERFMVHVDFFDKTYKVDGESIEDVDYVQKIARKVLTSFHTVAIKK